MAGMNMNYQPLNFGQFDYGFNNVLSSQGATSNFGNAAPQAAPGGFGSDNFGFMQNYGVNQPGAPQSGGFGQGYQDFMGQYGQSIGQGLSMAGSLFNLYGGIKSLSLMNKQFKLAKKSTRLGINNQATAYNNTVEKQEAASRSSQAAGHPASTANFERMEKWGG